MSHLDAMPGDPAGVVRADAAALPDQADLAALARRTRARRRRLNAVACSLLVAAGVSIPYAVGRWALPIGNSPVSGKPATPTESTWATPASGGPQRLVLSEGRVVSTGRDGQTDGREADPGRPNYGYPEGSYGWVNVGGVKEVLLDGRVITHPMPAGGDAGWVLLDDGRLVLLTTGDPQHVCSGVETVRLDVYEGTSLILSRIIGSEGVRDAGGCTLYHLVGASTQELYLRIETTDDDLSDLVAHRFTDGAERLVAAGVGFAPAGVGHYPFDLDITGGRRVGLSTSDLCQLRVTSLVTGATVAEADVTPAVSPGQLVIGCEIHLVRISPDGRLAAVTVRQHVGAQDDLYEPKVGMTEEMRLKVVDLAGGAVRTDELLYDSPVRADWARDGVLGLAWSDDTTVRVAFVKLPEPIFALDNIHALNVDVYAVEDVLQVGTFQIP